MKRAVKILAAALFTGLASGCAAQSTGAAAPAEAPNAAVADGRALYKQISEDIMGTREERLAAEKAVNDKWQNDLYACVTAAGQPYVKGPATVTTAGNQAPGDLDSIAELGNDGFGLAEANRYGAEVADADKADPTWANMTETERDAQAVAASKCFKDVTSPAEVAPAGKQELENELVKLFTAVEAQPEVKAARAGYSACMTAKAGITTENYADTHQAAYQQYPNEQVGWAKLSKDPKYTAAVAFEKKLAAADTECRTPIQDQALAVALPQLTAFATKHAAAMAAVNAGWANAAN